MRKTIAAFSVFVLTILGMHSVHAQQMSELSAFQFSFDMPDGTELSLADYKGKVVLVVNSASQCGFTPQYADLQRLYEQFRDRGLEVIAVPSNNFGGQEFDTNEEVSEFVDSKFEITFPVTSIADVSGDKAHPFYQWVGGEVGFLGRPKWNFHKYLIGPDGTLIDWYSSMTSPMSESIQTAIKGALNID